MTDDPDFDLVCGKHRPVPIESDQASQVIPSERYEFVRYRRTQIAEMRPYRDDEKLLDLNVSVSIEDMRAGSPKVGDMIARNPKNHSDQWLVAAQYFADNFGSLSPSEPVGGGELEPCPFCGGEAVLIDGKDNDVGFFVRCEYCELDYPATTVLNSSEKAIALWNERPAQPTPSEPVGDGELLSLGSIIHDARFPDGKNATNYRPFEREDTSGREYCLRIARAVIAATRPTQATSAKEVMQHSEEGSETRRTGLSGPDNDRPRFVAGATGAVASSEDRRLVDELISATRDYHAQPERSDGGLPRLSRLRFARKAVEAALCRSAPPDQGDEGGAGEAGQPFGRIT